jgi:hypothetical protein
MKKLVGLALVAAVLAMIASGAWADDKIKIKREYYTPYGKVKVKEKVYPGYYPYPYYYPPAYAPYYNYYPGYQTYYPPYQAPSGPYYYNPYYPSYPAPAYPYGKYKVEVDD